MESDRALVCYFTGVVNKTFLEDIKSRMQDLLPAYMIPDYWRFIQSFPLTINGKIDIKKLRDMVLDKEEIFPMQVETALQKTIISVWKEILQTSEVGLDDNFFDVGGNSIKIVSLYIALKKKLDIEEIMLVDMFKYPSIRKYADFISDAYPDIAKIFNKE